MHSSTLYLKHALNQEALANIDVSQHSAGSWPRERGVKDQTTTAEQEEEEEGRRRRGWGVFGKQMEGITRKRRIVGVWELKAQHNMGAAESPPRGSSVPWETHSRVEGLIGCLI